MAGCWPLIGLDGCFLKGYFGGKLLFVMVQDENNCNFVIAYAIVDVENRDDWKWLHQELGDNVQNRLNFISDMPKVTKYCMDYILF